ncbi:hypothetical protein SRHO_G00128430, partial [Serrasalmus rhombeus]
PPSCRLNCGYSLGSCSCSSSCQYYGNCCHDYYDYCEATTPTPDTPTVQAPCGGDLTKSRGEFFSPQYPNNYPNNARCTWRLLASERQVVRLTFKFVELETCCDSISVYDGPSDSYSLLGRLPEDQRRHFYSTGNSLTVVFSSDISATYRGFQAQWRFSESHPSPSTVPPEPSVDPSSPTSAPPSCRWSCGYNLGSCSCSSSCQYYGSCCRDYYDYCYPNTPAPDTTTESHPSPSTVPPEPSVDPSSPTSAPPSCRWSCGYNLGSCSCSSSCQYYGNCCRDYYDYCYPSTPTPDTPTVQAPCGGDLTNSRGEFFSPQFPNNYPNNARCTWRLLASERQVVNLTFTFVELETCCDSISVYDGPSDSYSLLAHLPEDQRRHFYSTGNSLTVVFSSDISATYRGFQAQWRFSDSHAYPSVAAPEPRTDPPTGTSTPPSCRWNCGSHLGSCSCSNSCQYYGTCCRDYYDYCHIYTPSPSDSTTVASCRSNCGYNLGSCSCAPFCQYYGRCCNDYYDFCQVTATTPTVNPTVGGPCGGDLTNSRGEFFSPQFPNNYPNNAYCAWTLLASETQVVNLTFTFVDLEECCDSIRVYDGPSATYPLLAHLPQDQRFHFSSPRNYLTVVFSSDHRGSRRGFRAQWVFSERPSCRGNCGYSFIPCSCTSSCQYYGNCCHDYYTYCQATTEPPTVTRPTCGGYYFDSGSISSPDYPNDYPNYAECVWQVSAPAGQRIFLSFVDLELQHCCDCDYINVYDGSSTASSLLGKLCYNDTTLRDFHSSSSYMTVLFRSDGSGGARGFIGFFSSSLPGNTARVVCSSESMTIVIQRSYLDSLGIGWQNLYVDDHRCRPSANRYEVSFNFPIDMCGTNKTTKNGRVVYSNHVQAAQSKSGEITRQVEEFLLSVNCHKGQDTTVGTVCKTEVTINSTISGTGHFNTSMAFYHSRSFSYPILEFPYKVRLDQYLYVQVQLSKADNTLNLLVDSCVASPNHDFKARSYTLIQNGCVKDNTVHIYTNGRQYYAQFRFRAFKFLRTHSYVFLQCRVVVCADNDYNSRCRQGCRMRKRRSLDSSHHTETVTLGPITLKGAESAIKVEKED